MSTSMQELFPFLSLMKETAALSGLLKRDPIFCCIVWEDNKIYITVATIPEFTPKTNNVSIKDHHFRRFVNDERIIMNSIDTIKHIADILSNFHGEKSFCYLRHHLMGW